MINWCAIRIDSTAANDRIIDLEGVWLRTESGDRFLAENGGSDLVSASTYSASGLYQLTWLTAPTDGTSGLYVNQVLEDSEPGSNALEPTSREIAMAARATDGAAQWDGTMLEWACWSAADTTAFDFATLHAYGADLLARAAA